MDISAKFFSFLIACAVFLAQESVSWAEGSLVLLAETQEGRQRIFLNESNGIFQGQIKEGLTVVTPVKLYLGKKALKVAVGEKDFELERLGLGEFISYGGVVFDNQGISVQVERTSHLMKLSGVYENELGKLLNFSGIANKEKGVLEIFWEDKSIVLRRVNGDKTGKCQGLLIKENTERIGKLWCKSSGALKDAFFKDPDQILAWLVIFFVK